MRSKLSAIVEREIRAANGGALPDDAQTFERAAARFGFDVEYHEPPFGPQHSGLCGTTIHVPIIDADQPLHRCYLHELAEACLRWEGHEPYVMSDTAEPHDVARAVDLTEPRKYLTQDLHRRIARQTTRLAILLSAAGCSEARITIAEDGTPTIHLG